MNYYSRIQQTIDYIDTHLNENITLEKLAEIASLSKYYYHRLSSSLLGESVMSYIRKRRLSRCAMMLSESSLRIIDIALENGFESQEVFIRAFTKYFGITPAKYRKLQTKIKLTDKISLLGKPKEIPQESILPKIVVQKELLGVGMQFVTTQKEIIENMSILRFHEMFKTRIQEITGCIHPHQIYGICEDDPYTNQIYHTVFVEVISHRNIPNGMNAYHFDASRYLIFSHKGSVQEILNTYHYIYHDWLPNSDYELSKTGKDLQIYINDKFDGTIVDMDICVPIDF